MSLWKEFLHPQTVQEAVDALASAPSPAIPIAGGTDLMLDLQQGHHAPVHTLVDLTGIAELCQLEIRGEKLFIGAGMPHNRIVESALVQRSEERRVGKEWAEPWKRRWPPRRRKKNKTAQAKNKVQ